MDDNAKLKNINNWIKFLNAEEVKFHLTCAALYLTAYEMLIDSILKFSRDFYITGWNSEGYIFREEYKTNLKSLYPKDIVIASAMWFHSGIHCLNEEDVELINVLLLLYCGIRLGIKIS